MNQGNLLDGTDGQADLIIANIIADIIILVLPEVAVKLRTNGRFRPAASSRNGCRMWRKWPGKTALPSWM